MERPEVRYVQSGDVNIAYSHDRRGAAAAASHSG